MTALRRRLLAGLLSATVALPLAAVAQNQATQKPDASQKQTAKQQDKQAAKQEPAAKKDEAAMKKDAAGAKKEAAIQLPSEPKRFAERLSMMNKEEIEVGRLAQERASDPQVKEYARMLVEHHEEQQQALTQLASQKKWKLGEGQPLNEVDKKVVQADKAGMEKLKALEGKEFDGAFLSAMVADHDRALRMVDAARQQYDDADLKKSLGETRSALQEHWQQAYRLLGETKPAGS